VSRPGEDLREAAQRKGSFVGSLRAVAWSFFGVRKGAAYEQDIAKLNPVHVILAGIVVAIAFIVGLVLLVNWVIGSGVAK
jgi:hypothetical protein